MHFTLRSKALYFAIFSGLSYGIYRWATSGGKSADESTSDTSANAAGMALGIPGSALAPLPPASTFTAPQPLLALLQEAAAASAGMATGTAGGMRLQCVRISLAKPGTPPSEAAAALPAFLQRLQAAVDAAEGGVEYSVAFEPALYEALRLQGGVQGGDTEPCARAETCVPGIIDSDLMATSAALAGASADGKAWTTTSGTHLTAAEHRRQYCGAPAAEIPSTAASSDTSVCGQLLLLLPAGPAADTLLKGLKGGHGWYGPPVWDEQPVEVPLAAVQLHPVGGAFLTGAPPALQLSGGQPLLSAKGDSSEGGAPSAGLPWWYAPSAGQLALVLGKGGAS